ncbi:tetratricopeptide repeat protein 12 isoform X2 [Brienomyrus brachyistius]|uniref:tetratricopeptide repeat protein 12 isoform X2 n=1 Tax=Brienomyrus brachyistius TaxID=42636 RepID=UPI0020B32001|nr:tetratricopeptide repeat protein 12 isoform X2 [Brienomyrus brachyistius]
MNFTTHLGGTDMLKKSEDMKQFLKNVDEISDLMKELSSSDVERQEKAVQKADRLMSNWEDSDPCRTRLNRTVINSSSSPNSTAAEKYTDLTSESFMKVLEMDSEDRKQRRKENEKIANALKVKGNEAFAQGDYEAAIQQYTAGLNALRDMEVLYTNRAQAFMKMKKYKEVINDSEWALKCNEKSIKAFVLMAGAHTALQEYTEARLCYQRVLDMEPGRAAMIKEYLTRVDLQEKTDGQEREARVEMGLGTERASAVRELLKKLEKPDKPALYYCGGLEVLTEAVVDSTGQTLFRLYNGFSVVDGNGTVRSCLSQDAEGAFTARLRASVLRLWGRVCRDNEENQQVLIERPSSGRYFVDLLASGNATVQTECLALLQLYIQTRHGRHLSIAHLNLHKLVESLWACLSAPSSLEDKALGVLQGLAVERRFQIQMRENFTKLFVPTLVYQLRNINTTSQNSLARVISIVGSMAADDVICKETAGRQECWDAFAVAMEQAGGAEHRETLCTLSLLIMKLSASASSVMQEFAVRAGRVCMRLLNDPEGSIITRAVGLLSVLLPCSPVAIQEATEAGLVKKMLKILKAPNVGLTSTRCSMKTLAVCTGANLQARVELLNLDKRLNVLRKLLCNSDEVVAGNAALCLGHCVEERGAASALLDSNVLPQLLRLAGGDAGGEGVQRNAAVALGKLCISEPRHTVKLRELQGLEILHSCMKLVA